MLGVLTALYLLRKLRGERWARHTLRQLRLEEQFVRHGPTPEDVLTCIRRRTHLWRNSLALQGLRRLLKTPPAASLAPAARHTAVRATYDRCFRRITPGRVPVDLLGFVALAAFWLWSVPEALLQAPSLLVVGGGLLWLLALGAEVVQAILRADVRAGFHTFTGLLGSWTLARQFGTLVEAARRKPYRHVPLYHAHAPPGLASSSAAP